MQFERTAQYIQKLFEQAMFDDKKVIQDASVVIVYENGHSGKLKAYCEQTDTWLQFPTSLRRTYSDAGKKYICDVIEVINPSVTQKYFRVMKGSIRLFGSDEVVG
jgi:hypothetical protein